MWWRLFYLAQETQKIKNCNAAPDNPDGTPGNDCVTNFPKVQATSAEITTVLTIVFGVVGAIAVIYMVLSALKFVTSGGDPQSTAQARQAIIYAAIGLAVSISAEVIVNVIIKRL